MPQLTASEQDLRDKSDTELLADLIEDPLSAARSLLANSVEDPLEASPLCSKIPLADSVEDPLEASPLCSKVVLADSVEDPLDLRAQAYPMAPAYPMKGRVGSARAPLA